MPLNSFSSGKTSSMELLRIGFRRPVPYDFSAYYSLQNMNLLNIIKHKSVSHLKPKIDPTNFSDYGHVHKGHRGRDCEL